MPRSPVAESSRRRVIQENGGGYARAACSRIRSAQPAAGAGTAPWISVNEFGERFGDRTTKLSASTMVTGAAVVSA